MKRYSPILLVLITVSLSGCAGMLYNRESAINNPVKREAQVNSQYAQITQATTYDYRPNGSAFVFELTPLGILAPLFGYPPKSISYGGLLALRPSSEVATKRALRGNELTIGFAEGGSWKTTLDFNNGSQDELLANGKTVEFSPPQIEINVECRKLLCTVTATPSIIADDGTIGLVATELRNEKRLAEIRAAEIKAKLAAEDAARKAKEEAARVRAATVKWEAELPARQEAKCPSLTTELQVLKAAANEAAQLIGPERAAERVMATYMEWKLYRCDFWAMRKMR